MNFTPRITPSSPDFKTNRESMLGFIERLRELEARAEERSMRRLPTFEKRNQIAPYDRLRHLLDPGMPFLRLFNMANFLVSDPDPETSIPGGSVICGIGYVSGSQ